MHRCECGCVLDRDVAAAKVVLHLASFSPGTGRRGAKRTGCGQACPRSRLRKLTECSRSPNANGGGDLLSGAKRLLVSGALMPRSDYRPPPPIDPPPVGVPWLSWEPCAIGRRRHCPRSGETIVWDDLDHGTLAATDAIRWQREGRIELRHTPQSDGRVLLEARPSITASRSNDAETPASPGPAHRAAAMMPAPSPSPASRPSHPGHGAQ
jgi:hypothetical protein